MERMTLKRCFIDSWGMALNAVVSRPVEVAGLFAILYVVNFIELTFWTAALGTLPQSPAHHWHTFATSVHGVVTTAIVLFLTRKVMFANYVMDPHSGLLRAYWRICGAWFLIGLGCGVALIAVDFAELVPLVVLKAPRALWVFLIVVSNVAVVAYVFMRLSLLNFHVMLGGAWHWGAAWRDTRGYFWRIFFSHLVTVFPFVALALLVGGLLPHADLFGGPDVRSFVVPLLQTLIGVPTLLIMSACSFWIYQRLARGLIASS